ncbi:putative protein serine/threonine kinase [Tieghemostelium lacteum]|uniref:non-specific serine/threonine protein kinase n=1 Tax=Tieghemostelium lacteum TaxID=361077 RepID=A0A151Z7G3_TIELA|nr:putative protein serine/threonine kinase [Tieghemostelium lacteum]|eukprot:KYQ89875.1 putative protein serine/threonine kinase [Tieghemostelium lacteum]
MDKYEEIKVIGKGSFGKAILVKRKDDGQLLVLKQINVLEMSQKERDDAMNEVNLLSCLNNENIIAYHDSFLVDGCLHIIMEYANAGDIHLEIKKRILKKRPFKEFEIISWFIQICNAIQYISTKNILHRDLKTQNIFLTIIDNRYLIKLGDFGIAKILNSETSFARTVIGTPYYLSPEICEDRPYDHKSDVWSLGCVLYELATLKHAFNANSLPALIMKILKGTYPPVPSYYSSDLRSLISTMLQTDPKKRPSITEILSMPFLKPYIGKDLKPFSVDDQDTDSPNPDSSKNLQNNIPMLIAKSNASSVPPKSSPPLKSPSKPPPISKKPSTTSLVTPSPSASPLKSILKKPEIPKPTAVVSKPASSVSKPLSSKSPAKPTTSVSKSSTTSTTSTTPTRITTKPPVPTVSSLRAKTNTVSTTTNNNGNSSSTSSSTRRTSTTTPNTTPTKTRPTTPTTRRTSTLNNSKLTTRPTSSNSTTTTTTSTSATNNNLYRPPTPSIGKPLPNSITTSSSNSSSSSSSTPTPIVITVETKRLSVSASSLPSTSSRPSVKSPKVVPPRPITPLVPSNTPYQPPSNPSIQPSTVPILKRELSSGSMSDYRKSLKEKNKEIINHLIDKSNIVNHHSNDINTSNITNIDYLSNNISNIKIIKDSNNNNNINNNNNNNQIDNINNDDDDNNSSNIENDNSQENKDNNNNNSNFIDNAKSQRALQTKINALKHFCNSIFGEESFKNIYTFLKNEYSKEDDDSNNISPTSTLNNNDLLENVEDVKFEKLKELLGEKLYYLKYVQQLLYLENKDSI